MESLEEQLVRLRAMAARDLRAKDQIAIHTAICVWEAANLVANAMSPRTVELAERLVAPGSFPNMSASEGHELSAALNDIQGALEGLRENGIFLGSEDEDE